MESLPDELVLSVLHWLPRSSVLGPCRAVCRRWRALSLDPSLWRRCELTLTPPPREQDADVESQLDSAGGALRASTAAQAVVALRLLPCLSVLRLALPSSRAALADLLDAACSRPLNLHGLEIIAGGDMDDVGGPAAKAEDAVMEESSRQLDPSVAATSGTNTQDAGVGGPAALDANALIAQAVAHGGVFSAEDVDEAMDAAELASSCAVMRVLRAQLSPSLRKLSLTFSSLQPQIARDLLPILASLPELLELRLECASREQGEPSEFVDMPSDCVGAEYPAGRVTSLHIAGLSDKLAEVLVRMQARTLEHLHLSCPDGLLAVLPAVSEHCPGLVSLSLRGWWKLFTRDQLNYFALRRYFLGAKQLRSLRLDYKFHSVFDPLLFGADDFALLHYILPALASEETDEVRGDRGAGGPAQLETLTLDFLLLYHAEHGQQLGEALNELPHLHTIRVDCLSERAVLLEVLARSRAPQLRLVQLTGCDANVCPNWDEGCSGLSTAVILVRWNRRLHVAGVGLTDGAPQRERRLGVYGHPEGERFACPVCLEHGVGTLQWLSLREAKYIVKGFLK